jgi:hypothetical protein
VKGTEFLDQLSDDQLIKMASGIWSFIDTVKMKFSAGVTGTGNSMHSAFRAVAFVSR